MPKKHKPPTPPHDGPTPAAPPGASFDTEAGRAAHGMRKDLGGEQKPGERDETEEEDEADEIRMPDADVDPGDQAADFER